MPTGDELFAEIMPFGTYKGERLNDVPKGYLARLLPTLEAGCLRYAVEVVLGNKPRFCDDFCQAVWTRWHPDNGGTAEEWDVARYCIERMEDLIGEE
jgi:hypothetical protein